MQGKTHELIGLATVATVIVNDIFLIIIGANVFIE